VARGKLHPSGQQRTLDKVMYMVKAMSEKRESAKLEEHYAIEKELASRLRNATQDERRQLYRIVYDERSRRIPHHPLVVRALDSAAQARAVSPQLRLLHSFVNRETMFLEVGPGDCALSLEMTKWVKHVYAADVSAELVSAEVRPHNFEFHTFDGINLSLPQNSIDTAYSHDVIEHLHPDDAQDQLRSILAALVPGGKYICVTPNRLSGPHDISKHFDRVATGFHLREYTITELVKELKLAGFSKASIVLSYHGYVLSPTLPVSLIAGVERLLEKLPRSVCRRLARVLAVVKVIGTK
jgi:SAM-dependent methyltransferase